MSTLCLITFVKKEGIIQEVAAPYSHEYNGVNERKNRTLKDMMNVFLISSSALDNLWGKVFLMAYFLQIRIPHRKIWKTHLMSHENATNQTWNIWEYGGA